MFKQVAYLSLLTISSLVLADATHSRVEAQPGTPLHPLPREVQSDQSDLSKLQSVVEGLEQGRFNGRRSPESFGEIERRVGESELRVEHPSPLRASP